MTHITAMASEAACKGPGVKKSFKLPQNYHTQFTSKNHEDEFDDDDGQSYNTGKEEESIQSSSASSVDGVQELRRSHCHNTISSGGDSQQQNKAAQPCAKQRGTKSKR